MSKAVGAAFACALCMSLGLVPLFMGTFPLFLQPVSREFGWGAAIYPQAALVAGITSALAGPIIGRIIDRFGVRPVMLVSLLCWAGSLVGFSLLSGSRVQLLFLSAAMGVVATGCGPIAFAKVLAGWFVRLGLALGIVLSAAPAVATAMMVALTGALLPAQGWRFSYRIFAAGVVSLAVPVAFLLMREADVSDDPSKPHSANAVNGLTASQSLRHSDFWKVMLLTGLVCGVVQSFVAHFVTFSAEYGVSPASATMALSAFSLIGPLGPLLAGILADRLRGPRALVVFYSFPLLGFLVLMLVGAAAAIPAMVLIGVGFQAATGMLPYLLTRYFGVCYASQLFGIGLGIVALSMGIGPVILGLARDRFQSFTPATPILLALLLCAIAIGLALRKYESIDAAGLAGRPSPRPAVRPQTTVTTAVSIGALSKRETRVRSASGSDSTDSRTSD